MWAAGAEQVDVGEGPLGGVGVVEQGGRAAPHHYDRYVGGGQPPVDLQQAPLNSNQTKALR